ncbi:MAG: GNAT family N-acetyltransferase [Rhizobiaceae bacterium]
MVGNQSQVHVLLTLRAQLRPHTVDDYEACAAMWADERVVSHISVRPSTRSETWSRLLGDIGIWHALNLGNWVVEERGTGAYLGDVGFVDHKRDITPSIDGNPEIGWVLEHDSHAKDIATEAASAAIEWGDQDLKSDQTVYWFNPNYPASIQVAEKKRQLEIMH